MNLLDEVNSETNCGILEAEIGRCPLEVLTQAHRQAKQGIKRLLVDLAHLISAAKTQISRCSQYEVPGVKFQLSLDFT